MSEQALPLGPTGSIAPGRSVAAMFELAAKPGELVVGDELRAAWAGVNDLVTHIDNNVDRDYPGSRPEGAPEQVAWGRWFEYLRSPSPEAQMPEDNSLTDVQKQAFTAMRGHFDTLSSTPELRMGFVINLWMYLIASHHAKHATKVGGHRGFAYWREREANAIASLFTSIVPEGEGVGRGRNFHGFVGRTERMGQAFKLNDSRIDLDRDIAHGNVSISPTSKNRISLLGRTAWHVAVLLAGRPRLLVPFVEKGRAARRNLDGRLNDQRGNL